MKLLHGMFKPLALTIPLIAGLDLFAATNDAEVLAALLQGGKVVQTADGFDVETGGKFYHAVKAPHGYDLTGPDGAARLVRTREGFDVVPVTTNRLRKGAETAAAERDVHENARHKRGEKRPR